MATCQNWGWVLELTGAPSVCHWGGRAAHRLPRARCLPGRYGQAQDPAVGKTEGQRHSSIGHRDGALKACWEE